MAAILKAISDLNVSPFEAAMGRMGKAVDKFQTTNLAQMGRMIGGAFSVYAIARFAAQTGQAAHALQDLSGASGVGVENLQALQVLFQQNVKEAGDVAGVMARLRKSMDEATSNANIAESFRRLGISFEEVASLAPDKVLERIARAMQQNAGDMAMGEAAGNLLGRSYAELQGAMNQLASQGLDPLRESLKSTNQIMAEDSVRAAAAMQEAYEQAGRKVTTSLRNVGISFVGGLRALGIAIGGGGWDAAATDLFGAPEDGGNPLANFAENKRKQASADLMRQAANKQRDKAIAAANAWFSEQSGKINVGNVQAADQLGKIGGYVGGQTSPAMAVAERQLKVLELQEELQRRIAAAGEQGTDKLAAIQTALEE